MRDWYADKICNLRKDGLSYDAIAHEMKITRGQVAGILHRAGMTRDPMKRNHARKDRIPREMLLNQNLESISAETGIPASTLKDWRLGR